MLQPTRTATPRSRALRSEFASAADLSQPTPANRQFADLESATLPQLTEEPAHYIDVRRLTQRVGEIVM
jgi:hypothetical protein